MTDMRFNSITTWHDWYLMQYKTGSGGIESAMSEILVDIRDNLIVCDCNLHNVVTTIQNSFYRWSNNPYTTTVCHGPPELKGQRVFIDVPFDKFICNLTDSCSTGCLCQEKPEEQILAVNCSNGNLTTVPKTVPYSKFNNIHLALDDNSIEVFHNVSYLDRIISLTMSNNDLKTLPEFVMQAVAKDDDAKVDFRNNRIKVVPESTRNIKYQNAHFTGNNLECSCDMIWMKEWIELAPSYADKGELNCTFEEKVYNIIDLDESILNCHDVGNILLIVMSSVALAIVIVVLIFAKRCPYETKVVIFRIFRIHPADKYKIDGSLDMTYDMCVTFDDNDYYVRQWVKQVLFKNLEEKKPFYKLCTQIRDGGRGEGLGSESTTRLDLLEKSRRLLIILSQNFENRQWNDYDLCQAETLEQNEGRVMFVLYDKIAIENATKEPLASKLKERKVFSVHDKLLWSKLRYELPRTPCGDQPQPPRPLLNGEFTKY